MAKRAAPMQQTAIAPAAPAPTPAPTAAAPAEPPPEPIVREYEPDTSDGFGAMTEFEAVVAESAANAQNDVSGETETTGETAEVTEPAADAAPAEATEEPAAEATDTAEAAPAAPAAETPPSPRAERREARRDMMVAIKAEQEKRAIEAALKAEKEKGRTTEAKAAELEQTIQEIRSGRLDRLFKMGLSRDQLLEKLIVEPDEPVAETAAPDAPDVAALKAQLEKVNERLESVDKREAEKEEARKAQTRANAVESTKGLIRDLDIPIVHAIDAGAAVVLDDGSVVQSGSELVLEIAVENWKRAGMAGNPSDFIPAAAKAADDFLASQRRVAALAPALLKRTGAQPAKAQTATEAGVAAVAAARPAAPPPSSGRRVSARTEASEDDLPPATDLQARDAELKRRFGLV